MQNYHRHTSYSEGDSAAMPDDYAKRAVELGHKVISSVEHGWQGYYHRAFELAKEYNLYRQDYCGCMYAKNDKI